MTSRPAPIASASLGACPVPAAEYERIGIAHGGGGRLTQRLIERVFLPAFDNPALVARHDGANLDLAHPAITMTTDSYVVRPIFFPGGDIGSLAIHGTVNDLAVCGARPLAISAAFILEEGLGVADLDRIVQSMRAAVERSAPGLRIVCGDTKVIERSGASEPGLMITTTGLGARAANPPPLPSRIAPGDSIILSGPLGDHGMAIMSAREGLEFDSPIVSDSQPLWALAEALLGAADVHCMRDTTRGGLSSALNELAPLCGGRFMIEERAVCVRPAVSAACEILGLDPFYVACEGRIIAFVAAAQAQDALAAMRAVEAGRDAAIIGTVDAAARPDVIVRTIHGALRPLDMLSGEQLPRIC